jgi:adenylylsulfate kinase
MSSANSACVIWFTGLPGSGKTTIAQKISNEIHKIGKKAELLDGDEIRKVISSELGFTRSDRETHARRVVYLGKLLSRNGVIAIVALVSPYRSTRFYARRSLDNFVEVWTKCSLETCMKRDPKGLYKNAREGKVTNFTGIQDPYEEPTEPEMILDTEANDAEECTSKLLEYLLAKRKL